MKTRILSWLLVISMAFSFFGMRFIEESISDPIENTSGALCTLLCVIFLGDTIALPVAIAIGVIAIGVVGIGYLENSGDLRRQQRLGKKLAVIAFCMPFLYAIIDAFGCVLDIYYLEMETSPLIGITEENIELVANLSYEFTFAICAVILFAFMKWKGVKFELPKQGDKIVAAVCETAGQLTYVYAMSGNGAIAAPILSSVCVVSLLLSRIFLKEKLSKKHYLMILLIVIGIAMMGLQDTLKYVIIVVSTLPLMMVYPFVQKYFVKGVMIGAVKG